MNLHRPSRLAVALACSLVGPAGSARLQAAADPPHVEPPANPVARPGEQVTLSGEGFGTTPGHVILTGRRIPPESWSETHLSFIVPEDAASGFLRVRPAEGPPSADLPFTVRRTLPAGQIAPYGLQLDDTGLPGAAFLVETDGTCLYGISGFETLCTYALEANEPHRFCSRVHLNQRVADLRVRADHLFCVGDHGLLVYRCADLRAGTTTAAAALAGGSYLGVDVNRDPTGELDGLLLALSEHAPRWGSDQLRVVFYHFVDEELTPLGTFTRTAAPEERQFGVALDPLQRKAYVSGWVTLTGTNKYLLELDTTELSTPALTHREETGHALAADMEAVGTRLWTGVTTTVTGNELFRTYRLGKGTEPVRLDQIITGRVGLGRVARVRVVDHQVTVGCAWFGNRPDVFLLNTFGSDTTPVASLDSLDWAFDVTGLAQPAAPNAGKVLVADEWGGFLTLDYRISPQPGLSHRSDYQWVAAAAMTEGLHLAEDRIYVAGRGAGPWSARAADLGEEAEWRHVDFDWSQPEPQPNPVSAVCTRRDPGAGLLIAALGHEKAMAWGNQILALLYRETPTNIELLAQSAIFDPPGLYSQGVSAVWTETDLVFLTTGSDGFRACVVDPTVPAIAWHRDCTGNGFATNVYGTGLTANCLRHWSAGNTRKLIVGSKPGLLVASPALNLFSLSYPDGVPDRTRPDAPIRVVHDAALECMKWRSISNLDVRPAGWVAAATSAGLALFHLSWVPTLNTMNDAAAWNLIQVPPEAYAPWWEPGWGKDVADVSFGNDTTLYVVKATEGVWRMSIEWDPANRTHRCLATGFYPGVQCGMDYRVELHGWGDPDIATLHHPYGVVADGATAFVTGWSGKVQRLIADPVAGVCLLGMRLQAGQLTIGFTSPFDTRTHVVETTVTLTPPRWAPLSGAVIRQTAPRHYLATCPATTAPVEFHRIRVRP